MDISELMEQYAQALSRYEECESIVESEHRSYLYAVESSEEFNPITLEVVYNSKWAKLIPERKRNEDIAKKEFEQAKRLLDFVHKSYCMASENMSSNDAMQNQMIAESKYLKLKEEYDNLSELRESSEEIGKKNDHDYGYEKALPYYNKSRECYYKMKKLEPIMRVYESFSKNLKYNAEEKQKKEYGSKKL